jgi:hypothetical protein
VVSMSHCREASAMPSMSTIFGRVPQNGVSKWY